MLPKYKFQASKNDDMPDKGAGVMVPVESSSGYVVSERVLLPEDAVSPILFFKIGTVLSEYNIRVKFTFDAMIEKYAYSLLCDLILLRKNEGGMVWAVGAGERGNRRGLSTVEY